MRARKKKFKTKATRLDRDTRIKTFVDGEQETTKMGKKGDYVITGPKGETYTINDAKLRERYDILSDDGEILELESKPVEIEFEIAEEDIEFEASWGEKMIAKKGDALVQEDGKLGYRIEKGIFHQTYDVIGLENYQG